MCIRVFLLALWRSVVFVCVCVRVKPEALMLLLVRTQTRGVGNSRYEVNSPLHLSLCATIPDTLWDEYCRLSVQ